MLCPPSMRHELRVTSFFLNLYFCDEIILHPQEASLDHRHSNKTQPKWKEPLIFHQPSSFVCFWEKDPALGVWQGASCVSSRSVRQTTMKKSGLSLLYRQSKPQKRVRKSVKKIHNRGSLQSLLRHPFRLATWWRPLERHRDVSYCQVFRRRELPW